MKKNNKAILVQEILAQGSSKDEAQSLANLTDDLSRIWNFDRPQKVKDNFLKQYARENNNFWQKYQRQFIYAIPIILILFVIFGTAIVKAQGSKPGDILYPVKVLSDKIYSQIPKEVGHDKANSVKKEHKLDIKVKKDLKTHESRESKNSLQKAEHSKAPQVLNRVEGVVPTQAQDAIEKAKENIENVISGQEDKAKSLPNTDEIKKETSSVTLP